MSYKDIIKLAPTLQAAALAGYNAGKLKKKKKKMKDFIDMGTTNAVGTAMIQAGTYDF